MGKYPSSPLVQQVGSTYVFYLWNEDFREATAAFTIYALSGSDRQSQSTEDGRFVLFAGEDVIYAARMESGLTASGMTESDLINSFHLIHQAWKTGET